jgi:transposase-like protein
MAVRRRVFAPAFKAKIVEEVRGELNNDTELTEYAACVRVGDRWQIHQSVVRSWVQLARGEEPTKTPVKHRKAPRGNQHTRKVGTGHVYDDAYKAAAVAELHERLPGEGGEVWAKVAAKHMIHATTLRSWVRAAEGAPRVDEHTGKRTRALPPGPEHVGAPSLPATTSGSHELTHERHAEPRDPEGTLKWAILGSQSDANRYLARRIDELEDEVKLLRAEKVVLMQAMGMVNTHKVSVT